MKIKNNELSFFKCLLRYIQLCHDDKIKKSISNLFYKYVYYSYIILMIIGNYNYYKVMNKL